VKSRIYTSTEASGINGVSAIFIPEKVGSAATPFILKTVGV
jgi:hypothetical protein